MVILDIAGYLDIQEVGYLVIVVSLVILVLVLVDTLGLVVFPVLVAIQDQEYLGIVVSLVIVEQAFLGILDLAD